MPALTPKAQVSLKVGRRLAGYAGRMIRYRRQNALTPEKDAEITVNLTPLLFFAVGYVAMRALLGTLMQGQNE
ncbi:hypothetical protein DAERI_030364 [Deinococcus aerius]|uniref:Uncharacterized protein n=1 Tax=Deinococcus aerius TaxID=200253 RepID=A0A2I9DGF1_9DEIO|nr:hypothetical protein DAERI_030364 [Deinococcus aerius]